MHLYSGSSVDFISDAVQNRVAAKLEQAFLQHFRFKPGPSEVRSWQQSLRAKPDEFLALVKNTYRVLLTRGLLGCYVFFEDAETKAFVRSRIERRPATA